MAAMFSNTPRATGASSNLIEFKAGRSTLQPGSTNEKRKVVADKAKGLVYIKQSDDRLLHFFWKNRETGTVIDDLIIFPGDTEFVKLKDCPDGKVFLLKFKSSDERRVYWLQEPAPDADKNLVEKVNDILNNPPQSRSGRSGAGGATSTERAAAALAAAAGGVPEEVNNSLGGIPQDQIMQLLSFMGNARGAQEGSPSGNVSPPPGGQPADSSTPATSTPRAGASAQSTTELSNHLRTLLQNLSNSHPGGRQERQPSIDLSDVITGERVLESVRNNQDRLTPHLPQSEETTATEELEATVRAPQFRQASDTFGHAFQTGQLAPVFAQFGLPDETTASAVSGNILDFAKKLTETEDKGDAKTEGEAKNEEGESSATDESRTTEGQETPQSLKGPSPKRGKPSDDDGMDMD